MKTLVIALAAVCASVTALSAADIDATQTVQGNTAFAAALYGKLRPQPGNLFFSPYSISTALAMTYGGARGETAKQMAAAMRFGQPQEQLHPAFAALQSHLNAVQKKGKVKLAVANSLWPQKDYKFLPPFLDLCRQHYGVTVSQLDYVGATEAARQEINEWVETRTNRKIQELIKPGVLDSATRLVLANAIYFKGNWATQFDPKQSNKQPFHTSPDRDVEAVFMHRKAHFRYGEYATLKVLELPYAGGDLAMMLLLPASHKELETLESALSADRIAGWIRQFRGAEVDVYVPKFKITSEFSMRDNLAALGMTDAFTERADFSGMDGRRDLFISAVVHKAFVDVNEEGTEAAAATGVAVAATSMPMEPIVFRADRPFLFLIRDARTGSVLFMGRVVDPAK